MTGTGTQADPYIPTTLTEFVTAIGTADAYVALTQDINAADDPEYAGELHASMYMNCAELDGQGHTIRGITVRGEYFLRRTRTRANIIKNIDMLDMCHKKQGSYASISGYGSNALTTFERVRLSIKIDANGFDIAIGSSIYPFYCAFLIEYTTGGTCSNGLFYQSTIGQSTIYIKNATTTNNAAILLQKQTYFARDAFIFDAPKSSIILTQQNQVVKEYCYYAAVNCGNGLTISCGDTMNNGLVVTDDDDVAVTLASGWTRCSIAQLKDREFLSSIGWLP